MNRDNETGELNLRFNNQRIVFNDEGISNWYLGRKKMISQGPRLNIWRAPLDNDGIKGRKNQTGKALGRWLAAGLNNPTIQHGKIDVGNDKITTFSTAVFNQGSINLVTHYRITQTGTLLINHSFDIDESLPDLPRIGIRMLLNPTLQEMSWYGAGPHETYIDRYESGRLKVHNSSVLEQYVPYILPQDHGNHTDIRWLSFRDRHQALDVITEKACEASASRYPHEILTPAFHTFELSPDKDIYLCLDAMQRGVGGASCGPDTLAEYQVKPDHYNLSYQIDMQRLDGSN